MTKNLNQPATWIIITLFSLALLTEGIDSTSLSTAIPSMAQTFHTSAIDLRIAILGYLLSVILMLPASGWISDRFGTRYAFLAALSLFGIGSLGCGLAYHFVTLVSFRLLQGIGGGLLLPIGRQLIYQSFERSQLVSVLPKVPMFGLCGLVIGPLLGGLLTSYISWRWIFYINIPLIVFGLIMTARYAPNFKRDHLEDFDLLGFLLFAISLTGLLFLFQFVTSQWMASWIKYAVLGLVFSTMASYYYYIHHKSQTLFDFSLLKIDLFRIISINNLGSRFCFAANYFLLMLYFQLVFGYTPIHAALFFIPYIAGMFLAMIISKHLTKHFHLKYIVLTASFGLSINMILLSYFKPSLALGWIVLLLFTLGFSLFNLMVSFSLLAYADIPKIKTSRAVNLNSTIQQGGLTLGVGIGFLLLELLLGSKQIVANAQSIQAFQTTFLVLGIVLFLLSFNLFRIKIKG